MVTSTLNGKKIAYINNEWIDSDGKRIDNLNKPMIKDFEKDKLRYKVGQQEDKINYLLNRITELETRIRTLENDKKLYKQHQTTDEDTY